MAMQASARRMMLLSALVAGFVIILPILEHALSRADAGIAVNDALSERQKQTITAATNVITLLINWAFAIIGLNAWLIRRHLDKVATLSRFGKAAMGLSVISAVMSVFFGQLALSAIASLLDARLFALSNSAVQAPGGLQFATLITALGAVSVYLIDQIFWPPNSSSLVTGATK